MSEITDITRVADGWEYTFSGTGGIHYIFLHGEHVDTCKESPYLYKTMLKAPPPIQIVSLADEDRYSMITHPVGFATNKVEITWEPDGSPYYRVYMKSGDEYRHIEQFRAQPGKMRTVFGLHTSSEDLKFSVVACGFHEETGVVYEKGELTDINIAFVKFPVPPIVHFTVKEGEIIVHE